MTAAPPPAEDVLWEGGPALREFWPALALALTAVLVTPALYVWGAGKWSLLAPASGAGVFAAAWLKNRSRRYAVTSQRGIATTGFLSRRRVEVELSDIRQITLKQSFGQRLLGMGDVEIESAGGAEVELSLAGVARPSDVMEIVRKARLTSPRAAPPFPTNQS